MVKLVLVDVTFTDGTTQRMDIIEAAIEFFEKKGIIVVRVRVTTQVLKMVNVRFPEKNDSFTSINGQFRFTLQSGLGGAFVARIFVINLTGNDRTQQNIKFSLTGVGSNHTQSYTAIIPAGATRVRIEIQGFTDSGQAVSNVFQDNFIKTPDEPTPTTFKNCQCCGENIRIPADQPCPVCGTCPEPPTEKKSLFEQIGFETLIIGGLAVAALMPRGDKKK